MIEGVSTSSASLPCSPSRILGCAVCWLGGGGCVSVNGLKWYDGRKSRGGSGGKGNFFRGRGCLSMEGSFAEAVLFFASIKHASLERDNLVDAPFWVPEYSLSLCCPAAIIPFERFGASMCQFYPHFLEEASA